MNRSWQWKLLIIWAIVFVCAGCSEKEWTLSDIEKRIGVQIPSNATNIHTWVQDAPGDELIYIEFDIPLSEGDEFARYFCSGQLEQGMNPFYSEGRRDDKTGEFIFNRQPNDLEFGIICDTTRLLVDRGSGTVDHIALQIWYP